MNARRSVPTGPRARRLVAAPAAALLGVALAGCGAVGDIASAAGDGASSAAVGAAQDAALQQVCGAVGDGQLSAEELDRLRAAVRAAEAAGVDEGLVAQADELLGDGDGGEGTLDQGQVEQLQAACADTGTGTGTGTGEAAHGDAHQDEGEDG